MGFHALLNYLGGAFSYIRREYAGRIKTILNSWSIVQKSTIDQAVEARNSLTAYELLVMYMEEMGMEEGQEVEGAAEEEHEEEAKVEAKEEPNLMADAATFSISVAISASVSRRPLRKRMRRKAHLVPSSRKRHQGRTVGKSRALSCRSFRMFLSF